jgi:hypothetical protein
MSKKKEGDMITDENAHDEVKVATYIRVAVSETETFCNENA